jgi:hypothetical protein
MSGSRKTPNEQELRQIEDALIDSILDASPEDLRAELMEAGEDPDAYIALADNVAKDVRERCARDKLEQAKAAAAAFRAKEEPSVVPFDRSRGKAQLEAMRAKSPAASMMLAARKGEGLSDNDEEALLEALAELEQIEGEDGQE